MTTVRFGLGRVTLASAALLAAGLLGACKVDLTIGNEPDGFACTSNDDCVSGFICDNIGQPEGAIGRCVSEATGPGGACRDADGDGAFFGGDCPPDRRIDCDDTNNAIGPTAVEVCDGIDNDCDNQIDEGLPPQPCPLQVGLCRGATRECVDGAYADCISAGLYGPDFEPTEISCDGINNDCDNETDESCDCIPGVDEAFECGTETGSCERGIQLCLGDGSLSACVTSRLGRVCDSGDACSSDPDCIDGSACAVETCETSDDCNEGGTCVEEWLDDREDFFDDCRPGSEAGCRRSVCHYLSADAPACATDPDCPGGNVCIDGACRAVVTGPIDELCNGIDDDCNGTIDDDFRRAEICGPCPFNMTFKNIMTPAGTPDFVCIDWYEASRPDATGTDPGTIELYAIPRAGVIPWTGMTPEVAETVCRAEPIREIAGGTRAPVATKRLCKTYEWRQGCGGTAGTVEEVTYPYSTPGGTDEYVPGACVDGSLGLSAPRLTGTTETCCNETTGLCDMSGNVAEYVKDASNTPRLAGGGYNDTDPLVLSCGDGVTYQPVPVDIESRNDIGFRCCTLRAR